MCKNLPYVSFVLLGLPLLFAFNGFAPSFYPAFTATGADIPSTFYLPKVDYSTGQLPYTIASGDLDGDGKPELVTANYNSNTISVLRNLSTGAGIDPSSFAAKVDFATGTNPYSVLMRDMDNDGRADLIVTNSSDATVSVLRNTTIPGGLFSFNTRVNFATGTNPRDLAVADLNNDGKPDIITANTGSNTLSLLRNTAVTGSISAASFAAKADFPTGNYPRGIAIDALDVDGRPAIVVANQNSNTVSVLRNSSAQGGPLFFTLKTDYQTGNSPVSVVIKELNTSNGSELIVANSGSNTMSVFISNGTYIGSGFYPKTDFPVGSQPDFIAVGNVDNSGPVDFVLANAGSNTISVIQNLSAFGNINFAPRTDFATEGIPYSLVIADLDGDGLSEVATSNASGTISVFKVNPQQPVPSPVISSVTPQSASAGNLVTLLGSNFNTVGANNIIYFGAVKASQAGSTAGNLTVGMPAGATYQPVSVLNTATGLTGYSSKPFLPSFQNFSSLNISTKFFQPKVDFAAGQLPYTVASGDLDGDGRADLVVVNGNDNTVSVLYNTAAIDNITAASLAGKVDFATGTAPRSVVVLDMDNDGKPDIVVVNAADNAGTGSNTVSVLRNTSTPGAITSSSFAPHVDFTAGSFSTPYNVAVGDMNRDGKPDLIVANLLKGTLGILRNTSAAGSINASSFSAMQEFGAGMYPRYIAIGDLDGDNVPDIAVANERSASVSVLRNTTPQGSPNAFSFAGKVDFTTGLNPNCVAVGDVEGDGKLDLIVVNNGSNSISVLRNLANSGSIDASSFAARVDFPVGNSPFCVALGDLNGDRKVDLAVANAGSNSISVLRNASVAGGIDATSFASRLDFEAGGYPVYLTIADLDRDGVGEVISASAASNSVSVLKKAKLQATVITVSPSSGAYPGSSISLGGYYFNPDAARNTVYFGAVKGQVISATSTTLQVAVPAGATYQPISVLNKDNGTIGYSTKPYDPVFINPFGSDKGVTGNFYRPKVDFATGGLSRSVTIADIDGDGKPDLVTANQSTNTVSVMRNITNAGIDAFSFAAKVDFATGAGPFSVVASDVDADGKPDLVVANYNASTLSVLRNTSATGSINASSFAPRVDFTVGDNSYPFSVAAGDLDGDGKPELVAANSARNTVSVLVNATVPGIVDAGSFAVKMEFATGSFPRAVAIGDVTDDQRADIAVANQNDNTVSVLQNIRNDYGSPPIAFYPKVDYPVDTDPGSIAFGDMDGHSTNITGTFQLDIVTGSFSSNTVSVLRNLYSGSGPLTASSFNLRSRSTTSPQPYFIAVGDADGDGRPDVVSANAGSDNISVLRNATTNYSTEANFAGKVDFPAGGYPLAAAIGDLDGDGIAEVITANAAGSVSVLTVSTPSNAAPETVANKRSVTSDKIFALQELQPYPNPTKGIFTLQLPGNSSPVTNLELFNENGMVIEKRRLAATGKSTTLRLSLVNQPAGVYYVKLTGMHGVQIAKVVVQR